MKKIVFRILAGFLAVAAIAAGALLLSPVFDSLLNKVNGVVFILFALFLFRYSFTGKEKLFSNRK